ncbi:cytochrome c oxidase assembly protein [Corynebacterium pacaense]|uniref:cytochrome c oxidase assembly protein n=1 Tax=Corynebacterium pacaense TaxID=1816684 RepID=UPI0009BB8537|nr:cytochrome c oxidase assembly protein [Corynebacterium pacaense]
MDEQAEVGSPGGGSVPIQKTVPDQERNDGSTVRPTWPLYLLFLLVAGTVGAWISWGFLSGSLAALGIPYPGAFTTISLPFFRAVGWMLAALSAGSFLASTFLIGPRTVDGHNDLRRAALNADGSIAARTGAVAAVCFGLIALLMIPLVFSDVSGQPFSVAVQPASWPIGLEQLAVARAWLWSAVFAFIVGLPGLLSRHWITQPLLLVGSFFMVVPLGLEGHSASGGDHDYGTNSLLWHLVFMLLWVGGLMALIAHCRRLGPNLDLAVSRYSKIASFALFGMAMSGVINAAVRIQWSDWFTTTYGLLVVTKMAGVIVLAGLGLLHRVLTLPRIARDPSNSRLFARLAIVEVLVMAAVTGIAISMGRTPPPPPRNPDLSVMAIEIGYALEKQPTLSNVFTMWRFDIALGTIAILLAAAYLRGLYLLHRRGKRWSHLRTFWWMLGCFTLAVTVSSGIGMNMPATFSMHMVAHMILSMVVPVFLVLGAPLNLILEAVDPGEPGRPGPHEWVLAMVNNPLMNFIMHPAVNTVQFILIFYFLYLTPLYELMVSEHAGHLIMNFVFVISGYVYYWEMIGPDIKPVERTHISRLAWLVFSMPFHLFFGVYLMQLRDILAEDFYLRLDLPWEVDLAYDQLVGGGIAWASGSFPLIIVFGYLFRGWFKEERVKEHAYEKRAAETDDIDMTEYNEMLSRINQGHDPQEDYFNSEFGPPGSGKD